MSDLDDILRTCSKDQLDMMANILECPGRMPSTLKAKVSSLSSYLSSAPAVWLGLLPEADLRLLQRLVNAGPEKKELILRPDYPTVVETMHIVANDRDENYDTVEVWLPQSVYDLVAPHIRRVIAFKEKDGSFELERLVLGYMNAYGVISVKAFVNIMMDGLEYGSDMKEVGSKLASCPVARLYQEFYKGEFYLVSPFVEDVAEIIDARRLSYRAVRRYADGISLAEASAAGRGAPFCAWGMDSPQGVALRDMLEDMGFSGEELQEALHAVWIDSQFAIDEESTSLLFSVVTDRQDEIGSFELFKEYIDTVVAYANSIPKWFLKGHSSDETGLMQITVKVDDLIKEYNYDEPGLNLYKLGLAVRPVGADEPCPCGSGLSYRNCHGKFLS